MYSLKIAGVLSGPKHNMSKEIYRSTITEWLLKFSNNIGYLVFQTDGKCGKKKKKRNEKKLQYRVAVNSEKGKSRKSTSRDPVESKQGGHSTSIHFHRPAYTLTCTTHVK